MNKVIPLSDFREHHDSTVIVQIERERAEILTEIAYWDGPLEGLVKYEGRVYWYETYFDEDLDDYPLPRPYVIVRVPDEIIEEELYWNRLFRENVRDGKYIHPTKYHSKFYEPYQARVPPELGPYPIIGWFTLNNKQKTAPKGGLL